jgi:hypothetical protein
MNSFFISFSLDRYAAQQHRSRFGVPAPRNKLLLFPVDGLRARRSAIGGEKQ